MALTRPSRRPVWSVYETLDLVFDADFVASNSIQVGIDNFNVNTTYTTSHLNTMNLLITNILATVVSVDTAELLASDTNNRTIRMTSTYGERNTLTSINISGGASQPKWSIDKNTHDNDVNSPESGQPNTSEPPAAMKLLGWDYLTYPPRNIWNWIWRYTSKFIDYLDDHATQLFSFDWSGGSTTGYYTVDVTLTGVTTTVTGTLYYATYKSLGIISIPTLTGTSNTQYCTVAPTSGKWPDNFPLPSFQRFIGTIPVVNGSSTTVAHVDLSDSQTGVMQFYPLPYAESGSGSYLTMEADGWRTSGTKTITNTDILFMLY